MSNFHSRRIICSVHCVNKLVICGHECNSSDCNCPHYCLLFTLVHTTLIGQPDTDASSLTPVTINWIPLFRNMSVTWIEKRLWNVMWAEWWRIIYSKKPTEKPSDVWLCFWPSDTSPGLDLALHHSAEFRYLCLLLLRPETSLGREKQSYECGIKKTERSNNNCIICPFSIHKIHFINSKQRKKTSVSFHNLRRKWIYFKWKHYSIFAFIFDI